jgi:hypothetical protein
VDGEADRLLPASQGLLSEASPVSAPFSQPSSSPAPSVMPVALSPSRVGSSVPPPSPTSSVDTAVMSACPDAQSTRPTPLAVTRVAARSGSRRAATPSGPVDKGSSARSTRSSDRPRHALSDGQVHPLHKRRVEVTREPQSLEKSPQLLTGARDHLVAHPNQAPSSVDLPHLTVDQPRVYSPLKPLTPNRLDPGTNGRGQGVVVRAQTVAGEYGQSSEHQAFV